ncbi:MAG: hypothetical protein GY801_42025 [bacterium]|nr:hypothetical protein [bacterium]
MKIAKACCVIFLLVYVLSGCGSPAGDSDVSVQSVPVEKQTQSGALEKSSAATITAISKRTVKEKPGVTRVVITLDKKASYATSREGNQLVVNVFNAQMKSFLKQLDVQDPVVKSIVARQQGSSVKSIIDLTGPDVAYTPSTSSDPYQILVDVWQLSPNAAMKATDGSSTSSAVPEPVKTLKVGDVSSSTEVKEITVDMKEGERSIKETPMPISLSQQTGSSDEMPAQLEWFSEKLSQVLQEREKVKGDLLELEKRLAVKESIIKVLERKFKEANNRIVELEEDTIKSNSKTSLAEQTELAMRRDLQQVLAQLESASGTSTSRAEGDVSMRSQQILSKISDLQQQNANLSQATDQVGSLKRELDALLKERDDLRVQNEKYQAELQTQNETYMAELETQKQTYTAEIESLKGNIAQLSGVERQLQSREQDLVRLRKAIGDAAKLVIPAAPVASSQQPATQIQVPQQSQEDSSASPEVSRILSDLSEGEGDTSTDTQLVLADLIQQQGLQGPTNSDDYVLGPDDVLEIKVTNEENLDKIVTVSSDGFITYPLLGDLRVDGLTTAQFRAQVSSLLARDFLVDPEVMVDVIKPRSKKVYIMGLVKKPGYHELQGDERLLSTLLSAGGPNSFTTEVRILRLPKQELGGDSSTDSLAPIIVDLNRLFVEGDQTQNIYLQDGDVLMVAARDRQTGSDSASGDVPALGPQQFYVVGSVAKPGIYTFKEDDTVLDAVLRAGGFTEFASRNGTKVVREANGRTETFRVKMKDVMEEGNMEKNIVIMPGDMIIVPESFF